MDNEIIYTGYAFLDDKIIVGPNSIANIKLWFDNPINSNSVIALVIDDKLNDKNVSLLNNIIIYNCEDSISVKLLNLNNKAVYINPKDEICSAIIILREGENE